jgi:hypothetical protein
MVYTKLLRSNQRILPYVYAAVKTAEHMWCDASTAAAVPKVAQIGYIHYASQKHAGSNEQLGSCCTLTPVATGANC